MSGRTAASPPATGLRAAFVVNPHKLGGADIRRLAEELSAAAGWSAPLWLETTKEDTGRGQAQEALAAGVDVVVAAGGDGTVRAVAEVLAGTATPLALLPLGTGNLLARNLKLPIDDAKAAVRLALGTASREIDTAYASVDGSDEQFFLVMAGLGYDATIMGDTNTDLKDKVGWLAYVDSAFRNISGKPVKAGVSVDGEPVATRRVRSVMVGNCGRIQGGLEIFPGARMDDGILDVMTMAPRGRFGWFGVIAGVLNRGRTKDPSVDYFHGASLEIRAEEPLDFQLDGDPAGRASHVAFRLDHRSLKVRIP